jgi:hypothetical protein
MHPQLVSPKLFIAKRIEAKDFLAVVPRFLCTGNRLAGPDCQVQTYE